MTFKTLTFSLLVVFLSVHSAIAAGSALSQCKMGRTISGNEIRIENLQGKVVVIEEWGARCAPCLVSISHLVKLDGWYGKKGLVIIANEAQSSSKKSILQLVKSKKIQFTVTQGTKNPSLLSESIPRVVVFNVKGHVVYRGSPRHHGVDRAIKKALKEVSLSGGA